MLRFVRNCLTTPLPDGRALRAALLVDGPFRSRIRVAGGFLVGVGVGRICKVGLIKVKFKLI